MSYSFQVAASTKDEAKIKVAAEFDRIAAQQPVHSRDKAAAIASVNAAIDLLQMEGEEKTIAVSCSGYLNWDYLQDPSNAPISSAGINVSVSYIS